MIEHVRAWRSQVAVLLVLGFVWVGCGQNKPESGPASPGKPTGTATAGPANELSRTATPPVVPTSALNRRTGIAAIDVVIDAINAQDPAALASLVSYSVFPCTNEEGLGGLPKCAPGEAPASKKLLLPVMQCEGGYWTPEDTPSYIGLLISSLSPRIYAVTAAAERGDEGFFVGSAYSMFVQTVQQPGGGRMLAISSEGRIVGITKGCLNTAGKLFDGHRGSLVLLAPP